ncbi:hypothetical protein BDV97DRAFT_135603 [Delphinella strobiligena]|nr:hypothetical protein BDV97DRAFT_135603 [Delphinella strobiligena]
MLIPRNYSRTLGSSVLITQEIIQVLRGDASSKAFPHAATFDETVARTRTQFFLATILLHEFMHCVWRATHEHFPTVDASTESFHEPFYLNDRISELGLVISELVFGGIPYVCGWNPMHPALPYGLNMRTFPGNMRAVDLHGSALELGSPAIYGAELYTWTAISVKDIHKFFTKRFWDMEVAVSGGRALRLEWRVAVSLDPETPESLDPGESPTLVPNPDPDPVMLSNAQLETIGFMDYDYQTP